MHSPDNKMSESETCSSIQCTRKLLDCLDIAGKTYYKNAVQELQNLSDNDFVLRYQSEECKRILADVLDAKHLADELYSTIKDDNQEAKSRSKRLQDMLESIAGLRCTTNTRLEMKIAEYKRISKEFLEKKIDAIKLDQMECDRNSAEYKKMVDLKERTERAVKEVVEQMNKLEPDEIFDEIERLRKEKEYNAEVEGTLRPADKFNAEEYARILKNDMIFVSFTYQKAIDRLACVTNSQRQDIVKSFQQVYRKDLIIELNSLLLRQYEDLIDGLMMLPEEFDAYELNRAIHTDRDEDTMIEILCSRNNAQIQKINEAYRRMYRKELENDITGVMDYLDQLLVSLAKGGRMEKQAVDMDEAYSDAQFLYKAREKGWRLDESQLNMIMASRSYEQLKAGFDVYCKTYGRNIETDIRSGMLPIIKCVRNRPGYFAEKIYESIMDGTDDGTLIRVMVTRAEVDMVQIKQEFQKMYGQSFDQFVMKHREKTDRERKESKAHLVNSTMHVENKLEKQVAILDLTISLAEHRSV